MGLKIFLNGQLVDRKDAMISVFDHGLLYGDGIFEGIRLYDGCIFRLEQHLDRLFDSAKFLLLDIPMSRNGLMEATAETCRANKLKNGYIRLVVTRGEGHLGLSPRLCKDPTVFIIADKIQVYPEEFYAKGLEIITVRTLRNTLEALNPRVKSLNYLNNILAKIEAQNAGAHEALMLNGEGYVLEGTGDNIFIVKNGVIMTPPAYMGALRGITRDCILEIAVKLGYKALEQPLTRFDVFTADECFLTGTAVEIMPVIMVDKRSIGEGKPGRITRQLIGEFREVTVKDGYTIY